MSKQPFFSVIIPTYNRKNFFKIALESVLKQSFTDYELIVVDDGSTDNTKEIIDQINSEKISYFYQENRGPAAARNKGIKQAKGQFICFLDSDDRFCTQKLEITHDYIKKHPGYQIFHTEETWYRNGRILSQKKHHQKPTGESFKRATELCCISPSTAVIKKSLFKTIGYFDEKLPVCEDYDFWLRVTAQYPLFLIPEYLTIKEGGHSDQQSKKYPAMDRFRIYALEKILKTLPSESTNYRLAYAQLRRKILIYLKGAFNFRPSQNQLRDIERLIFEISRREELSPIEIVADLKRHNFLGLKNALIARRFPLTAQKAKIAAKKVFLNQLRDPLENNYTPKAIFRPEKIFIEKAVKGSFLVDNFKRKFPKTEIEELDYYSDYLKINKFSLAELKKPYVFIVKEKWDFLKPCPCTKYHLGCGYWILNLGFGCPYDCCYCFLQHYTNFPGIILPGNLDDFFDQFDDFSKKFKKPIRIGTGEFSDSLALDDITEYSKKLIPYFSTKPVLFELKTKSANIDNLLKLKSSKNIIISWSLNPDSLVHSQEIAVATLSQRLDAAQKVREAGYSIGFHFDPIIHCQDWKTDYQKLIDTLYSQLEPPFAWISLGTLRSNRQLKTITEMRFPQSDIFYGELLIAEDKKLRYSKNLRKEIYQTMAGWIRKYDTNSPIYLCMESKDVWQALGESNKPFLVQY